MYQMLPCCGEIMGMGGAGQPAHSLGGCVRRMSHSSHSYCNSPDSDFNMSHWKKAGDPTPKFRPIFHLWHECISYIAIFPLKASGQALTSLLQMDSFPMAGTLLCSEAQILVSYFIFGP